MFGRPYSQNATISDNQVIQSSIMCIALVPASPLVQHVQNDTTCCLGYAPAHICKLGSSPETSTPSWFSAVEGVQKSSTSIIQPFEKGIPQEQTLSDRLVHGVLLILSLPSQISNPKFQDRISQSPYQETKEEGKNSRQELQRARTTVARTFITKVVRYRSNETPSLGDDRCRCNAKARFLVSELVGITTNNPQATPASVGRALCSSPGPNA